MTIFRCRCVKITIEIFFLFNCWPHIRTARLDLIKCCWMNINRFRNYWLEIKSLKWTNIKVRLRTLTPIKRELESNGVSTYCFSFFKKVKENSVCSILKNQNKRKSSTLCTTQYNYIAITYTAVNVMTYQAIRNVLFVCQRRRN